jgi:hypothetical protein
MDLWLRLLAARARFAKLDRVLYAWRQHPASATRNQPRYRRERIDALRLDHLRRGLLRQARSATLVGVGAALERCGRLLSRQVTRVTCVDAARPMRPVVSSLAPPVVLAFGAPAARARWRETLLHAGWVEGREFVFIA